MVDTRAAAGDDEIRAIFTSSQLDPSPEASSQLAGTGVLSSQRGSFAFDEMVEGKNKNKKD